MQYILSLLPLLACPVGMGLMMWFMMRGNKQQTPGEVDQARMQTYKQPRAKASPPTMAEAPKRAATFNLLGMCLNWKVIAGLAGVALLVLVLAPQLIGVALPLLLVAACPLSMLFMMRGMSGNGNQTASQPAQMQGDQLPAVGLTRDQRLAELKSRLSSVQAEQEAIARHIAEIESPEVPVVSEAEAVARAAQERNRKRTAHRRR
jgi:hypothetical protein